MSIVLCLKKAVRGFLATSTACKRERERSGDASTAAEEDDDTRRNTKFASSHVSLMMMPG
jgi:hypothetical protein